MQLQQFARTLKIGQAASARRASRALRLKAAPLRKMAMSYEPSRTKAYGNDIRWRMVYQVKVLDYSVGQVSANLGVSPSTVRRIVALFDTSGSVDKRLGAHQTPIKLTSYDEWMIMELRCVRTGVPMRIEPHSMRFGSVRTAHKCTQIFGSGFNAHSSQSTFICGFKSIVTELSLGVASITWRAL